MDKPRRVKISKFLSKHLRHEPERLGLELEAGGWVAVEVLLAACAAHHFPVSRPELDEVVATSDKQRFAFDPTGCRIRANQGHSVEIDLELEQATPPALLYHGTPEGRVAAILQTGLRKMARHHVHLSPDVETAQKVGARRGQPIVLVVDAAAMHRGGYTFYRSANGVWLTDHVPPDYVQRSDEPSPLSERPDLMTEPLHHPHETSSNTDRAQVARLEPRSLRTYTPTQAVLAKSAGIFHWTPEGRRLYDFTSGVLVANLGHNPTSWMRRFAMYMGWPSPDLRAPSTDYFGALPLTAYNAVTPVETDACRRLVELLQKCPGGRRLEQVFWAASGSEAIQKALWAALARDRTRDIIIATRYGFHGKKGLAGAVTGCETDRERDPRVRFVSFPMTECADVNQRDRPFDPAPYRRELEALRHQFGRRLAVLITEPYLGGGGSYHPPKHYLQMLQEFCREHDLVFILDEVQSNFGRTGDLFAFETYGLEPDVVVLGKGLGNGVPVAAAVGRADLFASLDYGEGSDTWSANPLCCAAVLATLDEFASRDVLGPCRKASAIIEQGLVGLKELPVVTQVRGERGGMVWGVEFADHVGRGAAEWANAAVLACYRGDGGDGIHLLGPLAKKVIRIAPPLVISEAEAKESLALMRRLLAGLATPSAQAPRAATAGAR